MWLIAQVSPWDVGIIVGVIVLLAGTITWAIGHRAQSDINYKAELERRNHDLAERLDEAESTVKRLSSENLRLLQELFRERNGR